MTTTDLAKMMNVTEADLDGFLAVLRHWMGKGLTLDQAIERNLEVMKGMANRAQTGAQSTAARDLVMAVVYA